MEGVVNQPARKAVVKRNFCSFEVHNGVQRRVTIVYEYDRENQKLKYGAVIFKTTHRRPEKFSQKDHFVTAEKRFNEHPVIVENFKDDAKNLADFNHLVRKQLFQHGCKSN